MLTVAVSVITLVLVCFITFYVTFITLHKTVTEPVDTFVESQIQKKDHAEQEIPQKTEKPAKHGHVTN